MLDLPLVHVIPGDVPGQLELDAIHKAIFYLLHVVKLLKELVLIDIKTESIS